MAVGPPMVAGPGPGLRTPRPVDEVLNRLRAYLALRAPVGTIGAPGVERKLARACWALGRFAEAYQTGRVPRQLENLASMSVDDLLDMAPEHAVRDTAALAATAGDRLLPVVRAAGLAITAPVFVDRWAGADILAGHCLVDVTTTARPTSERPDWFYDLLGSAWLDVDNVYDIRSVGLYLARQGTFIEWSVARLTRMLGATRPVEDLMAEFRTVVTMTSSWPPPQRWVTNTGRGQ
jgi:hypothetical protein